MNGNRTKAQKTYIGTTHERTFGQLVVLGFDVTVFTPAPYPRHRL